MMLSMLLVGHLIAGPPPTPVRPPVTVPTSIEAAIERELTAMRARTTTELGIVGFPRDLAPDAPQAIAVGGGRLSRVPILLRRAPGSALLVPTDLSLSFFVSAEPGGAVGITGRPSKDDLAAAVRMALNGEARALETAVMALEKAGKKPPAGQTWPRALTLARLDPRLPAAQNSGSPSWHLFFGPSTTSPGNHLTVLMDAISFDIQLIDGRKP